MKSKYALRFVALGYLALLIGIPVALVFINAFQDGIGAAAVSVLLLVVALVVLLFFGWLSKRALRHEE